MTVQKLGARQGQGVQSPDHWDPIFESVWASHKPTWASQGRAENSECTRKLWWITMKKNCFCRKCPVPTCVTVATFCSLNAVKAHMVPCGAVSFYLSKLWDAKCKGDTHSSWLSPDIHPRLHLQEPLNNVRGSGASSPESLAKLTWAKSTKKKKKKGYEYCKSSSSIWEIQTRPGLLWFPALPGIWQFKANETTRDPVRTGWFQIPG